MCNTMFVMPLSIPLLKVYIIFTGSDPGCDPKINFHAMLFPDPVKSISIPFLKVYIILMGSDPGFHFRSWKNWTIMKKLQQKKLKDIGNQRPSLYHLVKRRSFYALAGRNLFNYSQKSVFSQCCFPDSVKSLSIPFFKVYIILMGSDPDRFIRT